MRRMLPLLLLLCLLAPHALSEAAPSMAPVPTLEPLPDEPVRVLISAAGDCTLGGEVKSGIEMRFTRCAEKNGPDYFFANVQNLFAEDDFTLVNLEGPLTTATKYASKTYVMRGDPAYASILSGASVDVVNLANNHTRDFGDVGYQDTLSALESAGVAASGNDILYIAEKQGYRIGFIGFERWHHSAADAVEGVKAARDQCDLLIVSVHWGEEYDYTANTDQQKLGRALIDAGADLVLGTHPHVIQGVERYRDKYIVYSLGNFCFGGNRHIIARQSHSLAVQVEMAFEDGVYAGQRMTLLPAINTGSYDANNYQPYWATGELAQEVMDILQSDTDYTLAPYVEGVGAVQAWLPAQ